MSQKNIVQIAEDYCRHFHNGQKRKGGNQEPYDTHPFAVRDILIKYGYDDPKTQAIALLHDTIEDTILGDNKSEIERRFGAFVYDGVYILSKNTIGKHADKYLPLFEQLGVQPLDEKGNLTPQAYKIRLMFSRSTIKRIKIADTIHNTETLSDLNKNGIERKIKDSETFYIPLGKIIAPIMVQELMINIENYRQSAHHKTNLS